MRHTPMFLTHTGYVICMFRAWFHTDLNLQLHLCPECLAATESMVVVFWLVHGLCPLAELFDRPQDISSGCILDHSVSLALVLLASKDWSIEKVCTQVTKLIVICFRSPKDTNYVPGHVGGSLSASIQYIPTSWICGGREGLVPPQHWILPAGGSGDCHNHQTLWQRGMIMMLPLTLF